MRFLCLHFAQFRQRQTHSVKQDFWLLSLLRALLFVRCVNYAIVLFECFGKPWVLSLLNGHVTRVFSLSRLYFRLDIFRLQAFSDHLNLLAEFHRLG